MKYIKTYENVNFQIGDLVIVNSPGRINNEIVKITEISNDDDSLVVYKILNNRDFTSYGIGVEEVVRKLDDHEIAALKYNI